MKHYINLPHNKVDVYKVEWYLLKDYGPGTYGQLYISGKVKNLRFNIKTNNWGELFSLKKYFADPEYRKTLTFEFSNAEFLDKKNRVYPEPFLPEQLSSPLKIIIP